MAPPGGGACDSARLMLGLLIVVVIILAAVAALRAQSGHWRPRERWVSPRQFEAANRAAWYAPMVAELP